jgi:hypothetical protein
VALLFFTAEDRVFREKATRKPRWILFVVVLIGTLGKDAAGL